MTRFCYIDKVVQTAADTKRLSFCLAADDLVVFRGLSGRTDHLPNIKIVWKQLEWELV
jgi:hypothetical protein